MLPEQATQASRDQTSFPMNSLDVAIKFCPFNAAWSQQQRMVCGPFFFIGIAVLQDTVLSDPPRVIIMWKAWKLNLNLHQMP